METDVAITIQSNHDAIEIQLQPPNELATLISYCQTTALDSDKRVATEASLFWLLSLSPDAVSKEQEKKAEDQIHWYCGKNGAKACWPAAVLTVGLLSFKRIDKVAQWRTEFEEYVIQVARGQGHFIKFNSISRF